MGFSMKCKILLLFYLLLYPATFVWANLLSGRVVDEKNNPIAYASIGVKGTTIGTSSNGKGDFYLEISPGIHVIKVSALGFNSKELTIELKSDKMVISIVLVAQVIDLEEFVVKEEAEDPALKIIRLARQHKDKYISQIPPHLCNMYLKASLEAELTKKIEDSSYLKKDTLFLSKERMNFMETYAQLYWNSPLEVKQRTLAYRDLSDKEKPNENKIEIRFGNEDKPKRQEMNPYFFKTRASDAIFNFYHPLISVPALSEQVLISPLHNLSNLSYQFSLEEFFKEEDGWVHKIKVQPKNDKAPLFSGYLYIADSTYAIKAIDFSIAPWALSRFLNLKIIQNYSLDSLGYYMLKKETFLFDTKHSEKRIVGDINIIYSDYQWDSFPTDILSQQASSYTDENALHKDSTYWMSVRGLSLQKEEEKFILAIDSLDHFHQSDGYKKQQDSIVNRTPWWEIAFGMDFQNSRRKENYFVQGLLTNALIGTFGIGGYRQRIEASMVKTYQRGYKLQWNGLLNYGFTNQDLKGHLEFSYTYAPKKFGRLHGGYSDEYGFINGYESISNTFSMGNYVNDIGYTLGNEWEVFNGVYVDIQGEYEKKRSIYNLTYSQWSESLFGNGNQTLAFQDFDKFSLQLDVKYIPFQKYVMEPYEKLVQGSTYPTFAFRYRKGIPGVIKSISNYDFVELRAWDQIELGTLGMTKWRAYTGKFLNSSSLLFTENKFFRRSDRYFFSDPLRSFQLLDTSMNTQSTYLQVQLLHRWNGWLLRKIPLIKYLQLVEVMGIGGLWIQKDQFQHIEAYVGIEKPIYIRRWDMKFKIGSYYVASYGNFAPFHHEVKFGIDFYDPFTKSWGY